jgi:hypothetical protein
VANPVPEKLFLQMERLVRCYDESRLLTPIFDSIFALGCHGGVSGGTLKEAIFEVQRAGT